MGFSSQYFLTLVILSLSVGNIKETSGDRPDVAVIGVKLTYIGLISPRGEYCKCDLNVALNCLENLLRYPHKLFHFSYELLASMFFFYVEIFGELLFKDRVFIFVSFDFVVSLNLVEAITSKHTSNLFANRLFVLLRRECFFESSDVEFD